MFLFVNKQIYIYVIDVIGELNKTKINCIGLSNTKMNKSLNKQN